jgi:hypothetical protein
MVLVNAGLKFANRPSAASRPVLASQFQTYIRPHHLASRTPDSSHQATYSCNDPPLDSPALLRECPEILDLVFD